MKVIMVPVADRPECRVALEAAFRLATLLAANVVGCHLRLHREEHHAHGAHVELLLQDTDLPELPEQTLRLNSEQAQVLFRHIAAENGVPMARVPRAGGRTLAFWYEMVGSPEKLFGIIGPTSDCIVVSRPRPRGSGPARAFLLAALLRSGKPLLVLPQKKLKALGHRVLVAWNQSTQAAAALTAALPLLARAEQVHFLCCGKEDAPGPKMKHAQNYLAHHGIESSLHQTKGLDVAREVRAARKEIGADLLVMGAYSRGHLRERLLGGATHDLVLGSNLPVFTLHP
jgi:nucleotide-binding universal stress UspA family protein